MDRELSLSVTKFGMEYLSRLQRCIEALDLLALEEIVTILLDVWKRGHVIFIAGNGGSAAIASHMACDLAKTVLGHNRIESGAFRVVALTDNIPLITAWANDNHYNQVFSGQLVMLAKPGDVLLLISGSGNSPNILQAADTAHEIGMRVVGLLGKGGGGMFAKADVALVVPSDEYGIIEDVHMIINHLLTNYIVTQGGLNILASQPDK